MYMDRHLKEYASRPQNPVKFSNDGRLFGSTFMQFSTISTQQDGRLVFPVQSFGAAHLPLWEDIPNIEALLSTTFRHVPTLWARIFGVDQLHRSTILAILLFHVPRPICLGGQRSCRCTVLLPVNEDQVLLVVKNEISGLYIHVGNLGDVKNTGRMAWGHQVAWLDLTEEREILIKERFLVGPPDNLLGLGLSRNDVNCSTRVDNCGVQDAARPNRGYGRPYSASH
ncbi:hypothetical protein MKX08_010148 [Trichoderma sp. CBMAI-0020]|nr:hypothetical protein MKX08_010148 [Trichoderma sp. CBMAI-0020]